MDAETIAALATEISQGNRDAENEFCSRYYPNLMRLMLRKARDRDLAQDICQTAFCIVLMRLRSRPLDEPEKLLGYLNQTASYVWIQAIKRDERFDVTMDWEAMVDEEQDIPAQITREQSVVLVRQLIGELQNERDREILRYYYVEDWPKEAICTQLGLTHRHFDRVIYRARERFRDLLLASEHPFAKGI